MQQLDWRALAIGTCLNRTQVQGVSMPPIEHEIDFSANLDAYLHSTAVYAYAAFEYNIPPVYTIQVDGGNTVNSGSLPPLSSICDPIYVNTNLPDGDHTLKLVVTNDDPLHISDFIFLGFIVTQSLGDTIPFPTGIGGSGNSGSASPSSTSTGGGFHLFGGSGHVVETSHTLLLAGFASLAAILL
ncbi:hypothetical protein FRC17_005049 [Serendipita sp. 399]|nr:hypothetical protein FRC17_005049 [Serendipita sp. 399]